MNNKQVLESIRGGLIVSCQAFPDDPLNNPYIMAKMAVAAHKGGAAGIRANTPEHIIEMKKEVSLPIIGIHKAVYPDSPVYITPTMKEVDRLVAAKAEIIAMDATRGIRPGGIALERFFDSVRSKYPDQLFMADVSNLAEGIAAQALGFDIVGTTLAGYTPYTEDRPLPDLDLIARLVDELHIPIIAEGGIWEPSQAKQSIENGAWAAVVGTAITRPLNITQRFVAALKGDVARA